MYCILDDDFTGPDALSDEELVTLEMTQPIWDSDPWQEDKDEDSSSHSGIDCEFRNFDSSEDFKKG